MNTSLPPPALQIDHALAPYFSLRLGGNAKAFLRINHEAELLHALDFGRNSGLPILVLGGGSNIVCSDDGFSGLVLHMALRGVEFSHPSDGRVRVRAAAGENWDALVAACCHRDLQGIECLSGIPGTVGACPIQNIGAYGQEVAETISSVRCIDRTNGELCSFSAFECEFAYRHSRFKARDVERYVIVEVTFELHVGRPGCIRYPALSDALTRAGHSPPHSVQSVRESVLHVRRSKSMLLDNRDPNGRNCGSFFLNPILSAAEYQALCVHCDNAPPTFPSATGHVKVPAAWLIEQAGFSRGERAGNVGLSTEHTLCLVAHAGATTQELLAFARRIRDRVWQRFEIGLKPEPNLIGTSW